MPREEEVPTDLVMTAETWQRWMLRSESHVIFIQDSKSHVVYSEGTYGFMSVEHSPLMNWLKRVVDEAIEREKKEADDGTA